MTKAFSRVLRFNEPESIISCMSSHSFNAATDKVLRLPRRSSNSSLVIATTSELSSLGDLLPLAGLFFVSEADDDFSMFVPWEGDGLAPKPLPEDETGFISSSSSSSSVSSIASSNKSMNFANCLKSISLVLSALTCFNASLKAPCDAHNDER